MTNSADAHRALADLASCQHGVVARRQLVALGLGRRAIEGLLARGRLHGVHRGVYLVGHRAAHPTAREMAALLAVGAGAALSHGTAAARLGLRARAPEVIDITVERRTPTTGVGFHVHRTVRLEPPDVLHRDRLRMTSPARTVLDLAAHLERRALGWMIEDAVARSILTTGDVRDVLARHRGRRGAALLRDALNELSGPPAFTRSEAERRLHDLIRHAGLPRPRANVLVGGWSVDAHWPASRLVVEVDGFAHHGGRAAFERDRRKDAALQAAGFRVARLSWRQITGEPLAVAALLARLLATD